MKLILASKSPRRIEMLRALGLSPEIIPAEVDENIDDFVRQPERAVCELSGRKAKKIYETAGNDALIIAADTLVYIGDKLLGKPRDEDEAREMLHALSGSSHEVYTGISVICGGRLATHCEKTTVYFRSLSEREIDEYISSGEPMDKAGAYGIQGAGALFVKGICGDYFNVVGLPISALFELIEKEFGIVYSALKN